MRICAFFSKKAKKNAQIFAYFKKKQYFCTRFAKTAGWMSDLVSGLQNRLERFDSATGLSSRPFSGGCFLWTTSLRT